jgi:hypothetical protein
MLQIGERLIVQHLNLLEYMSRHPYGGAGISIMYLIFAVSAHSPRGSQGQRVTSASVYQPRAQPYQKAKHQAMNINRGRSNSPQLEPDPRGGGAKRRHSEMISLFVKAIPSLSLPQWFEVRIM